MPAALHELLTFITVGGAVVWIVVHFLRRSTGAAGCDGCEAPRGVRLPRRGVRPSGLSVIQPGPGD